MNKLVYNVDREKRNSSPKCAKEEVIDLCDDEDDETAEYLSSSGSSASIKSIKRARNQDINNR